jgi:hypothetical protein
MQPIRSLGCCAHQKARVLKATLVLLQKRRHSGSLDGKEEKWKETVRLDQLQDPMIIVQPIRALISALRKLEC